MSEQSDNVGPTIRSARQARDMSLRGLASLLGLSPATLSALETGRAPVTVGRLQRIAVLLDTTVESLVRGDVAPLTRNRSDTKRGGWRDCTTLQLDAVLEGAAQVFVRKGFHGATMREVAAETSLSVAGVYHHYPSKQQLLIALLDVTMSEITWRLVAARDEGSDEVASFRLMVESLALFHAVRGDLAFLGASEMRALDEPERSRVVSLRDAVQHLIDAQADKCVQLGEFTVGDPRMATRAIATMCTSLPSWFRWNGPLSPEDVARSYSDYAEAMMRSTG